MTEIAQIYLGNINDSHELAHTVEAQTHLKLNLQQSDRHKGRIYAYTDSGLAVGIIKNRNFSLRSGDVFKTDSAKLLLIHLQEQELLVLNFSSVDENIAKAKLVYLGHVLGNHHYPITVQHNQILVQITTDKSLLEKLLKDAEIIGLKIEYQTTVELQAIAFSKHTH